MFQIQSSSFRNAIFKNENVSRTEKSFFTNIIMQKHKTI